MENRRQCIWQQLLLLSNGHLEFFIPETVLRGTAQLGQDSAHSDSWYFGELERSVNTAHRCLEFLFHFLFQLWDAKEASQRFEGLWPVRDRQTQARDFRSASLKWLEQIRKQEQQPQPATTSTTAPGPLSLYTDAPLRRSYFEEGRGERYEQIVLGFSTLVIERVLARHGHAPIAGRVGALMSIRRQLTRFGVTEDEMVRDLESKCRQVQLQVTADLLAIEEAQRDAHEVAAQMIRELEQLQEAQDWEKQEERDEITEEITDEDVQRLEHTVRELVARVQAYADQTQLELCSHPALSHLDHLLSASSDQLWDGLKMARTISSLSRHPSFSNHFEHLMPIRGPRGELDLVDAVQLCQRVMESMPDRQTDPIPILQDEDRSQRQDDESDVESACQLAEELSKLVSSELNKARRRLFNRTLNPSSIPLSTMSLEWPDLSFSTQYCTDLVDDSPRKPAQDTPTAMKCLRQKLMAGTPSKNQSRFESTARAGQLMSDENAAWPSNIDPGDVSMDVFAGENDNELFVADVSMDLI